MIGRGIIRIFSREEERRRRKRNLQRIKINGQCCSKAMSAGRILQGVVFQRNAVKIN